MDYLDDVTLLEDPGSRGQGLVGRDSWAETRGQRRVGDRASIWRFRVGDDRALRDAELVILTLSVDQRDSIDDT